MKSQTQAPIQLPIITGRLTAVLRSVVSECLGGPHSNNMSEKRWRETAEEELYPDETFKTGLVPGEYEEYEAGVDRNDLKLPNSVNFVALRETVLAEAPFVKRHNKAFWKKWIDSKQFINILAASQQFIADSLGDTGILNLAKIRNIADNKTVASMSMNVAELILLSKPKYGNSQDTLFLRLPEMICFMTVSCLQSSIPKFARIFNSVKFREVLLDWLVEVLGGMRITDTKKDKEWIFAEAVETTIIILDPDKARSIDMDAANKEAESPKIDSPEKKYTHLSGAVSKYSLEHSPIMDVYLNLGRSSSGPHVCATPVKTYLSNQPLKPINTIRPNALIMQGAYRERKVLPEAYRKNIKDTLTVQKNLSTTHAKAKTSLQRDMKKLKEIHRIKLNMISNIEASPTELLTMAKALNTGLIKEK